MIQNLSMVTRIVEDQETAIEFYTKTLGFTIKRDHPGPHGRFLTVAPANDENVELILMTPDGFEVEDAERLSKLIGNDAGLIYEVDDCVRTFETLSENGVEIREEPEDMPWGVQAVIADPDGNEIVIQEPVSADEF